MIQGILGTHDLFPRSKSLAVDVLAMTNPEHKNAVAGLRVDDAVVADAQLEEAAKLPGERNPGMGVAVQGALKLLDHPPRRSLMEPHGHSPWGGIPSEPTARGRGASRGIEVLPTLCIVNLRATKTPGHRFGNPAVP